MLCAVELTPDRATRAPFEPMGSVAGPIVAEMAKRGVIGRAMPQADMLGFAPPLCLTEDEATTIARVTADAVHAVLG
jgi:L-2,4-diaminobutyrate transaminase